MSSGNVIQRSFTADDLRVAFLALDVRTISLDEMFTLVGGQSSKDDYIVAVDTLRRENKGRGYDVTEMFDGRRHLARTGGTHYRIEHHSQPAVYDGYSRDGAVEALTACPEESDFYAYVTVNGEHSFAASQDVECAAFLAMTADLVSEES
jgi:hypothetical protein